MIRRAIAGFSASAMVASALLAAAVTTGVTGVTAAAVADPLGDAKAQAAKLQSQVAQLQVQAEQASERYNAAEAALGGLVGEQRAAQEQLTAAQSVVAANRAIIDERARALYMSGGSFSLYASVLQGADPTIVMAALHDVQSQSNVDKVALAGVDAASKKAAAAQTHVDQLLQRQSDLMAQAAGASNDVENALAQSQSALAAANDQVRTIEAQIQAQIDADNAARAAAQLAAARQAALQAGFIDGAGSAVAQAAIAAASTQLGKPYVYGGSGPDVWDCSGLTQWAYRQVGVYLPRTAAAQYLAVAAKVPLGELEPGDLLFWATDLSNPATIHHVAIYVGNGEMLAAPHTGTVVRVQPVYLDGYYGAARPG
jgi:cell wall-associated NlpC family hydrolase